TFKIRVYGIAEPIQRFTKRLPPLLIPARPPGIAPAVAAPALHPVDAAPRCVLVNLHFVRRGILLQKLPVIGDLEGPLRLDIVDRESECHLTVLMMMAVCFSIGCDMHQLRPTSRI